MFEKVHDFKIFYKSMQIFTELIQRYDLEIQENILISSPKLPFHDIDDDRLPSKEVIINTMKMNKININSTRIFYESGLENPSGSNLNIRYNCIIYMIFLNYIESLLLIKPSCHFFSKLKLENFFDKIFCENLFDSKVILSESKEKFTINDFFGHFNDFVKFLEETLKKKGLDNFNIKKLKKSFIIQ